MNNKYAIWATHHHKWQLPHVMWHCLAVGWGRLGRLPTLYLCVCNIFSIFIGGRNPVDISWWCGSGPPTCGTQVQFMLDLWSLLISGLYYPSKCLAPSQSVFSIDSFFYKALGIDKQGYVPSQMDVLLANRRAWVSWLRPVIWASYCEFGSPVLLCRDFCVCVTWSLRW